MMPHILGTCVYLKRADYHKTLAQLQKSNLMIVKLPGKKWENRTIKIIRSLEQKSSQQHGENQKGSVSINP